MERRQLGGIGLRAAEREEKTAGKGAGGPVR
jgi:hypothetical protein